MKRFLTESDRLEAFSDGVIAVIITIMVLDLRPPAGTDLHDLAAVARPFAAYVLSFAFVGIYWNNHHHMLRATRGINGTAMWANLHLLFWLSVVPFATAWLGAHPFATGPTVCYATLLLVLAIAYSVLEVTLIDLNGRESVFGQAVRGDFKGRASVAIYIMALICAFWFPLISDALFVAVAIMWFVPDRRYEKVIEARSKANLDDSEP